MNRETILTITKSAIIILILLAVVFALKVPAADLNAISDDYKYIGGKKECENYIKKMLASKHKDIYVTRTVLKKYKRSSLSNAVFAPGHQKVDY